VLSLQDHFQDITGYTGSDRSWVRCLLLESIYWRNTPIMRRQIPDRTRPMEVRQHSVGIGYPSSDCNDERNAGARLWEKSGLQGEKISRSRSVVKSLGWVEV
jgi:hypothetical protein